MGWHPLLLCVAGARFAHAFKCNTMRSPSSKQHLSFPQGRKGKVSTSGKDKRETQNSAQKNPYSSTTPEKKESYVGRQEQTTPTHLLRK